jgi:putative transposase
VWRLCSQQRIWSHFSKKRGLSRKAGPPVHDDLVQRDFTAQRANQLWLTDIERHEAFLNLAVVKGHRFMLVAAGM